jgi:hypothetical protein
MLQVFEPGTIVEIGFDLNSPSTSVIKATVVFVELHPAAHVLYHCAWWNDNVLEEKCLPACMVKAADSSHRIKIGFQPEGGHE